MPRHQRVPETGPTTVSTAAAAASFARAAVRLLRRPASFHHPSPRVVVVVRPPPPTTAAPKPHAPAAAASEEACVDPPFLLRAADADADAMKANARPLQAAAPRLHHAVLVGSSPLRLPHSPDFVLLARLEEGACGGWWCCWGMGGRGSIAYNCPLSNRQQQRPQRPIHKNKRRKRVRMI